MLWPCAARQVEPLGGGRIEMTGRTALIYGYSQAFGQAPHDVSAALVRRCYPLLNVEVRLALFGAKCFGRYAGPFAGYCTGCMGAS